MPKSELFGFIVYLIFNVVGCFLDMVLNFVAIFSQSQPSLGSNEVTSTAQIMHVLRWILSGLVPTINFKRSLFNIRTRSNAECVEASNSIMHTEYSTTEPWSSVKEPGVGSQLLIFAGQFIFWTLLLIIIENNTGIKRCLSRCFKNCTGYFSFRKQEKLRKIDSSMNSVWTDSVENFQERFHIFICFSFRSLSDS